MESIAQEIISLENVSVCYRVPKENFTTLKEYAIRLIQGKVEFGTFWALKDVNLRVNKGEIFGLIGRNGAGKSTLLKLVAKVLRPTIGRVLVTGTVAPLLEIGAGFHPDLTGRENVHVNAAILGYKRKEVDEHFDAILQFSELESFIESPLRTYSSGMVARLGFAVATEFRPDVLIVDEILGVGDEAFQAKCFNRIIGFSEQGTTIFLVSHSSTMIETICHRAAWLDHGVIQGTGSPSAMIGKYHEQMEMAKSANG